MKKLINILNSLMIISSSTFLTVSCNKLKSLTDNHDTQKKHVNKNVEDNEENDNENNDELALVFNKLKKLKKIIANTIADNKNTIKDLISELEQSEQINSITKAIEFSIEIENETDEVLTSGTYQFKIILDEEHKILIDCEVLSIDSTLSKLDEETKYEQIKTKIKQYLGTYDIEADGEVRLVDIRFTILEQLKKIIKPYNIKFDNSDFKINNDYFQDDEDIIFLDKENEVLTINVNLQLDDPKLRTITEKTKPIYSKDEIAVKETAVSLKMENIKNQIKTKIEYEFNQVDQQIFNVVSDDKDTYQDLINEIKQLLSRNVESDDIKLDNVNFKDAIVLTDKIKSNQPLNVSYDLIYNNFFYELDSKKVEEINSEKTFEFQIKAIDNLETKVEKVIANSSFDKLFFDKTLLKETSEKDLVKKVEDYLYRVSDEIKAMKDKYKFDLIFIRDTSESSFDHKFYNGKPAFKLKLELRKVTTEKFELKQAFYFRVYEDEKETDTNFRLARTDDIDIITSTDSFGIREKLVNILKTDEMIIKMQADGKNTFEDYINLVKETLNHNEQVNDQYIVQDVQFVNPIYNNQTNGKKIIANNKRLLIANNDEKEKYSLSIKLNDKINNDQIILNFIDAINIEGLYNLAAIQAYENKKISSKIKTTIDKIVNNNLTVKVEENTYQDLVEDLFNQFNDIFKMTNVEVKKENIVLNLTDEETLASKISKSNNIKFKIDFGYTNKYGEHVDKLTFDNNEINNLLGSQSREKIEKEFIEQLKEQILKFENLDEDSFVYNEIFTRANRSETIKQLINELNEKFINILQLFKVNNTKYFDFKISFASDSEDLNENDIVPTKPINLLLNVFNKNGDEKIINDFAFKIKIREANEVDKIQEKVFLLKNMLKTATLDLTSFSDQKSEYIANYPTWAKLLTDIKDSDILKTAIVEFINKNIDIDKFKTIASFIDEFKFEIKDWSKIGKQLKNNYVQNNDKQILSIKITSLNQNNSKPIIINTSVEALLGQFSETNFNKAIAKDIYLAVKNHFSGKITIDNTAAVKPKDKKEGEDDIVYFDYQILKTKIKTFIKSKISLILQRQKQQYHLTDEDIIFDIKFNNSLTDDLEHKDDDLVRYNDLLNFILSVKIKSSSFNPTDNETSEQLTIIINNNEGYIDAQTGLDKLEQDKFEKLMEVILKTLTNNSDSSSNECELKDQHYNVDGRNLSYEYDKFDTKKHVKEYFQILLNKIKNDLLTNETLKNWKIDLNDYNISLDFDKRLNLNLNTNMFSEPNYVVLIVESKHNNKQLESKIKFMPKNKAEYEQHVKVNELVNKIKSVFNTNSKEFMNSGIFNKDNLDWKFVIDPKNVYTYPLWKQKLDELTDYLNQIKAILKKDNVAIDFEVNGDNAIYDLKESVSDRKYKINIFKQNEDIKDIKILLNIKINGHLFAKQETIISSKGDMEGWQYGFVWYFNNDREKRDVKKFDKIAEAMTYKVFENIVANIEMAFKHSTTENCWRELEDKTSPYYKLFHTIQEKWLDKKTGDLRIDKQALAEISDIWDEINTIHVENDHNEFMYRGNINFEIDSLFNFFPALKNGEFTVIQKDPSDPLRPYIYKYTPFECGKSTPFINYERDKLLKIGNGDITISFEGKIEGKSFTFEKGLNVHDATLEKIADYAYIPFLLLWELSNNWI